MSVICIIQARMGSSRLPGKVLEKIGETPMLEKVVIRLRRARTLDAVVVATTDDPRDDQLVDFCRERGIAVSRGSVFDVLDRFHTVLDSYPEADIVVRVTADCPFVDPEIVDQAVDALRAKGLDFVANRLPPPASRTYPVGLDVEVSTATALRRAWLEALAPHQREHVMPYLYDTPGRFAVSVFQWAEDLQQFRWTVDEPRDLEVVRLLDKLSGPEPFGWRRVLEVARAHPEIQELNITARQKALSEVDDRWSETQAGLASRGDVPDAPEEELTGR
jgi:spore coat polysaccharide biosynthesis protein SpsF